MAKTIQLTQGRVTVVDDDVFPRVSAHRWCFTGHAAASRIRCRNVYLHRFITEAPDGLFVDHINGNPLDNRRANLRLCTHRQNALNRVGVHGREMYKGVTFKKHGNRRKRWSAQIRVDDRLQFLGYHLTPEEAACAYDAAALKHFGEFARLNFPGKGRPSQT